MEDRRETTTLRSPRIKWVGIALTVAAAGSLVFDLVLPGRMVVPHPALQHFAALVLGLLVLRIRCVVSDAGIEVVNFARHEWLEWSLIDSFSTRKLWLRTRIEVTLNDGSVINIEALESNGKQGLPVQLAAPNFRQAD